MRKVCLWLVLVVSFLLIPWQRVHAQSAGPMSPTQLTKEIEDFAAVGAKGYLMWQYSGDRGTGQEFANDPYSWFRNLGTGPAICTALKQAADAHGDMFIGVNMWDAGEARHSQEKLVDHFSYLKNSCGVKVIRTFAYAGGSAGVSKVLAAAQASGVQIIFAIGDYSNGGGGLPQGAGKSWYASGYQGEYLSFVREVLSASANNGALYGYELANEPHCGGDESALDAYISWGTAVGNLLKAGSTNVGYGQMASQTTTMCDTVGNGNFAQSNSAPPISMASAHYYSADEKANALAAAQATPAGKFFYIGEAGWGGSNLKPDDYYLYPVNGLAQRDTNLIRQSLVSQGYQVQCTAPAYDMHLVEGGDIASYKALGLPQIRKQLSAEQIIDLSQVQVPLWRSGCSGNGGPITNPFCSLEAYWSYADYNAPGSSNEEQGINITNAPVYRGLTLLQQCEAKVSLLNTIHTMCEKLDDPTTCALYQTVPGTVYTTQSLPSDITNSGFSCTAATDGSTMTDTQQHIYDAVMKVPFNLDKAYRLAFLVTCTQMKEFNGIFGFLSPGNAAPKDECRVMAFKIPDIGTNKDTGDMAYTDSLSFTRNFITSSDQQQTRENIAQAERSKLGGPVNLTDSSVVNCGSTNCTEPLTNALISMIAANGDRCEISKDALEYEPSSQIQSSGELVSGPGTKFSDGSDPSQDLITQPTAQQTAPQRATFNFIADAVIAANGGDKQTKTRSYLILPVGYELKSIEDGLSALLEQNFSSEAIQIANAKPYFKLNGFSNQINAEQFKTTFADPGSGCTTTADGQTICGRKELTAKIGGDTTDAEPRYPGGVFGALTRLIQMAVRGPTHPEYGYLQACQSTEDFLTGQCSSLGATGSSATTTNSCANYATQQVHVPSDAELRDLVRQTAHRYVSEARITAAEEPQFAQLIWGVLQIEGSPFLRRVRQGATLMSCGELMNSCGAVGPMQIIQGACVSDLCTNSNRDLLKTFERPSNICSIEGALDWAGKVLADYLSAAHTDPDKFYTAAGHYHGLTTLANKCEGAPAVQGCNGMNYCGCAATGFPF